MLETLWEVFQVYCALIHLTRVHLLQIKWDSTLDKLATFGQFEHIASLYGQLKQVALAIATICTGFAGQDIFDAVEREEETQR